MKKKTEPSRLLKGSASVFSLALRLASLSLGAPACANDMNDGKSGETHFLCQSDDDCSNHFHNDDYSCANGTFCTPKTDGGSQSSGGQRGGGGSSGGAAGSSGGSAGSGGSNDTDSGGGFSQCKTPPNSTCSAEDTCKQLGCGTSLQYDEHGCLRTQCTADADCGADERCALSQCEGPATCTVEGGQCTCSVIDICGQVPRCNPVTLAGTRGDWVSLDVTYASGPCPTLDGCTSTWHVAPDGHLTSTLNGKALDKQLDQASMFELRNYGQGVPLRLALRDGLPCMGMLVEDVGLTISLRLSTQTLTQQANGCISGDNVFSNLYQLLSHLPQ